MQPKDLSETQLHFEVERQLTRYVQCIDDDRLEAWPDFFTEACVYRLIARENAERNLPIAAIFCDSKRMLIDRVVSLRHANVYERHYYRHLVSSIAVLQVTDEVITVKSHYAVYRTRTNGATEIYNTGTYLDEMVVQDDRWLFQKKIVTFDTNRIDSLLVTPI
ncbi:MAG: aromatic-ring-hydroxylating dioxygenase subunit beta [Gammaproteobacteria bacterium]